MPSLWFFVGVDGGEETILQPLAVGIMFRGLLYFSSTRLHHIDN